MVHFEPPRFILNYIPVSKPVVQSIRGGTSFWVTAGNAGVRSSMLTVPVTFPPEDVPERRAALGPSAPRHPPDDGDVLLLRNRLEPLRGRQHRVRRHPQATGVRRRGRADRAGRPAESDRQAAAPRAARQYRAVGAVGRRQDEDRRARGPRGHPAAGHDSLEQGGEVGDDRRSATTRSTWPSISGASGSTSISTSTC